MVKAKIGLSMLYCLGESFRKMTRRLHRVPTANIEIVDDGLHTLDKQKVTTLAEIAASYNLRFSVHAPFADINVASPSKPLLNAMLRRLEKSISFASALDAYIWVFHPGLKTGISMFYPGMDWLQNQKTIKRLLNIASNHGVKVAIENMPEPFSFLMKSVNDFSRFYQEINEDIGLVFDVGHANLDGQIERFLSDFADKIVHVHVHDNDGTHDQHLGIGYGNIDWKNFAKKLERIFYDKTVIVESVEHVEESVQTLNRLLA
jgi:sugar phosphate isomerase/epimerase